MTGLLDTAKINLLDPQTLVGAVFFAIVFFIAASTLASIVRKAARRIETHLSDATGLAFASALVQVLAYLVGFVLYAHLIPALRSLGTALLAGVSVVSVVLGLAAQNTLANLIAGLSLVLYRPFRIGDSVQLNTPRGLVTATVEILSLGYTILRDTERNEILVPNSVMTNNIVVRLATTDASPQAAPD
ncbi:MAG: mechanosensitive ion channel family protein [Gallionella sp.]